MILCITALTFRHVYCGEVLTESYDVPLEPLSLFFSPYFVKAHKEGANNWLRSAHRHLSLESKNNRKEGVEKCCVYCV